MPLKVKCRCGQELVLRYSEWVYFVVGFLVLSILVNIAILILIAVHLGEIRSLNSTPPVLPVGQNTPGSSDAAGARREGAAVATREIPDTEPPAPASPQGHPDPPSPSPSPVPGESSPGTATGKTGPSDPGEPAGGPAETKPRSTAEKPEPPPAPPAVSPERRTAVEVPWKREAGSQRAGPPPVVAGGPLESGGPTREGGAPRAPVRALLEEAPPILRLLVIETLRSEEERRSLPVAPERGRLVAAFLHDPESRIRDAAARVLLDWSSPAATREAATGESMGAEILDWVSSAATWLSTSSVGERLVERILAGGEPTAGPRGVDSLPWEAVRRQVERFFSSTGGFSELTRELVTRRRAGTDLLLAIDVTESMEESFRTLQAAGGWLLPALLWSRLDSRLGLLFYRDEVVATVDFDSHPRLALGALKRERAAGGGQDVPEGVLEALRASLQLGRFSWRPGAEKIIIFIGDAPPPHEEKDALISLARQVHVEASYFIHAVSLRVWDGWGAVPYFPELARAGGGEAVSVEPGKLPVVLFDLMFPRDSREVARQALPVLRGDRN